MGIVKVQGTVLKCVWFPGPCLVFPNDVCRQRVWCSVPTLGGGSCLSVIQLYRFALCSIIV